MEAYDTSAFDRLVDFHLEAARSGDELRMDQCFRLCMRMLLTRSGRSGLGLSSALQLSPRDLRDLSGTGIPGLMSEAQRRSNLAESIL